MMDLFRINTQLFLLHKTWIDGLELRGLLVDFMMFLSAIWTLKAELIFEFFLIDLNVFYIFYLICNTF